MEAPLSESEYATRKSERIARRAHSDAPDRASEGPSARLASVGTLDFGPFLSLPTAARTRLLAASAVARFSPGETLVREGDPPGDVLALASGRVRIMTGDRLRTLATLAAPALIGEMAVV